MYVLIIKMHRAEELYLLLIHHQRANVCACVKKLKHNFTQMKLYIQTLKLVLLTKPLNINNIFV